MKNCIVVNFWADTEEKVNIVLDCISQLKKTGKDVIYTSLVPIDERIQEICTFSLYNNENDIITFQEILDSKKMNIFSNQTYTTKNFKLVGKGINTFDVTYSIIRQFDKNFIYLKQLGYDNIHFFVGDSILNDGDIEVLIEFDKSMVELNKKAYFEDLRLNSFNGYQTLYFYMNLDFYLSTIPKFISKRDWIDRTSHLKGLCLETFYYEYFSKDSDKIVVVDNIANNDGKITLFKNSRETIDLISTLDLTNYFVVWNPENNTFELYIAASFSDDIIVTINGKEDNIKVKGNNWYSYNLGKSFFDLSIKTEKNKFTLKVDNSNIDKLKKACYLVNTNKRKHKIKLLHLQTTNNDDREIHSRKSLENVIDYGIEYVLHQNPVYTSLPPLHTSLRPHNVRMEKYSIGDPEYGKALTPSHYGCFESFKIGIMSEFDKDLDFLMVCEGDCIIETEMMDFIAKVNEVCDIVNREGITYFSFGDTKTLDFRWEQSDIIKEIPGQNLLFITNKIIGLQCIMFPLKSREFLLEKLRLAKWDCMDTFFNIIFGGTNMGILKNRITTQADGYSLIDKEYKTFHKG
jgi:hypothetical protein